MSEEEQNGGLGTIHVKVRCPECVSELDGYLDFDMELNLTKVWHE